MKNKTSWKFCEFRQRWRGVIALLFVVALTHISDAQTVVGLKGGLTISDVQQKDRKNLYQGSYVDKTGWGNSFHLGGFATVAVSKRALLQLEFLLIDKKHSNGSSDLHLVYAALPVFYRFGISERFAVEGGVEPAFRLASRWTAKNFDRDASNVFGAAVDLGVGAGIVFKASERVSINGRITQGLMNVLDRDYAIEVETAPGFTETINLRDEGIRYLNQSLLVSLEFKLKKD